MMLLIVDVVVDAVKGTEDFVAVVDDDDDDDDHDAVSFFDVGVMLLTLLFVNSILVSYLFDWNLEFFHFRQMFPSQQLAVKRNKILTIRIESN
jgi:hypothetical protein